MLQTVCSASFLRRAPRTKSYPTLRGTRSCEFTSSPVDHGSGADLAMLHGRLEEHKKASRVPSLDFLCTSAIMITAAPVERMCRQGCRRVIATRQKSSSEQQGPNISRMSCSCTGPHVKPRGEQRRVDHEAQGGAQERKIMQEKGKGKEEVSERVGAGGENQNVAQARQTNLSAGRKMVNREGRTQTVGHSETRNQNNGRKREKAKE